MAGRVSIPGKPTARQAQVLAFIKSFTTRYGIAPSFEDIARHFGISPPAVNSMIKNCEARGFLARTPGAARTLRVLVPDASLPCSEFGPGDSPKPTAVLDSIARTVCIVIERIVPTLEEQPDEQLWRVLRGVLDALDTACLSTGLSDRQRRDARNRAVDAAIGVYQSARGNPGRRRAAEAADRVGRALLEAPR